MKRLKLSDVLTWFVLGISASWIYGCTSWKELPNLNEARSAALDLNASYGKTVTLKTLDGCTYQLKRWKQDESNNIIGEGTKGIGWRNRTIYEPFSGIIPADSIVVQKEILVVTREGTEYELDEWNLRSNGDISGKGSQEVTLPSDEDEYYRPSVSRIPFEGVIQSDSIGTVQHQVDEDVLTLGCAVVVGSLCALVIWTMICNPL